MMKLKSKLLNTAAWLLLPLVNSMASYPFATPAIEGPDPIFNFSFNGGTGTGSLNEEIPTSALFEPLSNRLDVWFYNLGETATTPNRGGDRILHISSTNGGQSWSGANQIIIPTKRNADGTFEAGLDWPESGVGVLAVIGANFTFHGESWSFIAFGEGGDFSSNGIRKQLSTIGAYFIKADGETLTEAESGSTTNPALLPYNYNDIATTGSGLYGAGLPSLIYIPTGYGLLGEGRYRLYFYDDTYDNVGRMFYAEFVPNSNSARGFDFVTPSAPAGATVVTGDDGIQRVLLPSGSDGQLLQGGDVALIDEPGTTGSSFNPKFYLAKTNDSGGANVADVHAVYTSSDGYSWTLVQSVNINTYSNNYPARIASVWQKNQWGRVRQYPVRLFSDYVSSYVGGGGNFGISQMKWSNNSGETSLADFESADSRVSLGSINCGASGPGLTGNAANDDNGIYWDCVRDSVANDGVADVYFNLNGRDLSSYQSLQAKWAAWQDDGVNGAGSGGSTVTLKIWVRVGPNYDWVYLGAQSNGQFGLTEFTASLSPLSAAQKQDVRDVVLRNEEAAIGSSNIGARQRMHVWNLRARK